MILKNAFSESLTLKTTLYDLIESIYEELKEDEADLIVQIVSHMLKSTRAKFRKVDINADYIIDYR
jgi:hypothetical protein